MQSVQSPLKIHKLWKRVNERFGVGKDVKAKLKDKSLPTKDQQALKQNEKITKGLQIMRTFARGGLADSPGKTKRFEKTRAKTLRVMKKYCKLVKATKLEKSHENLVRFRKSLKQFIVVVEDIEPTTLTAEIADDDSEVDLTAIDDVDTSKLDQAMEDPSFGDYPDEEFDEDDELAEEQLKEGPLQQSEAPQQQSAPDPKEAQWRTTRDSIEQRYLQALKEQPDRAQSLRGIWGFSESKAEAGNYQQALVALKQLEAALTNKPPKGVDFSAWQLARESVITELRKAAAAIAATKHPQGKAAIIELQSIIAQLTPQPNTPQSIAELESYLQTDDVVADAERLPTSIAKLQIRDPLLRALGTLKQ